MRTHHLACSLALLVGCNALLDIHDFPPPDAPTSVWRELAVGGAHGCGIDVDRELWCWGRNAAGELGVAGAPFESDTPVHVEGGPWETVAVSSSATCAIDAGAGLWCWGRDVPAPTRVDGMWRSVALGVTHACAIDTSGTLSCWGENSFGQLGVGTTSASTVPLLVAGGPWTQVAAGGLSTCGIQADASLWCWGSNQAGELGLGAAGPQVVTTPTRVDTEAWKAVAIGVFFTCAIRASGEVRCTGLNAAGQLGDGTSTSRLALAPLADDATFAGVTLGVRHGCAWTDAGALRCWGDGVHGQLGLPDVVAAPLPRDIPAPLVGTVVAGGFTTCAIGRDGAAWCVGLGGSGQRGDGMGSVLRPTQTIESVEGASVEAGALGSCQLGGGVLACWGFNGDGRLGDGTTLDRQTPVPAGPLGVTALSVGTDHACAATPGGLWCWGQNVMGQLGDGTTTSSTMPRRVLASGTFLSVSAGAHTCAVTAQQEGWCWGPNDAGQVGSPPSGMEPPQQVPGAWRSLVAGERATCGIDSAGNNVACFGSNASGELGDGMSSAGGFSPRIVALQGDIGFAEVAVGAGFACARSNMGTLSCWGANHRGQVGNGTVASIAAPVVVAGAWDAIAAGGAHACGLQAGSLWCWGSNTYGQLGDGSFVDARAPIQIGVETDWQGLSAGDAHTCAVKTNGSIYCWGSNSIGQLGNGRAWTSDRTPLVHP